MEHNAKEVKCIIDSYTSALSLFKQLLAITEAIKGLAQDGRMDRIGRKIQKKGGIIAQINLIESGLLPHQKRWKFLWQGMSPQARKKVQSLVQGIREINQKIRALNKETEDILFDDKEKVDGILKRVARGHKLIKRYATFNMGMPRYLSRSA